MLRPSALSHAIVQEMPSGTAAGLASIRAIRYHQPNVSV